MLNVQRLCHGDENKQVEHQATRSISSSEWISTEFSLEAQGYDQGNIKLWLQKPEFIAYKVPFRTNLPIGSAQT